ncbi:Putative ATP-dependent RNA helicase DDX60, partial [Heterocephalus glaber]
YCSLFNDFVESEFFLIDGDSLLITCICEKFLQPGQNLHFFYLVEHYLMDLINKGGQFTTVFFQDAEYTYFSSPELLPLRTALILHLQKNTSINVCTQFTGCLSKEWKMFLDENYPYFLIVADEGLNPLQTQLFNFLIIQCWSERVNVVLFSGQTSDILRLYAYFLASVCKNQNFFMENENEIRNAYKMLLKKLREYRALESSSLLKNLASKHMMEEACETICLLQQLWPNGSDIRRVLCVTSCSMALGMYHHFLESREKAISEKTTNNKKVNSDYLTLQDVEDLCKLHCLSVVFLLHIPLSQRACSRVFTSHWVEDTQMFFKMKKWCEYFILCNTNVLEFWNLNLIHLSDLSDEPLLKNITLYYENENVKGLHLNLGNAIMKDYEHLWETVSKLVRKFNVGKAFPVRTTELQFLEKNPSTIKESSKEKMPTLGFIPMSSQMVDKFVGDIFKDLPFLRSDDPIVTSLVKQKEFDELVHWHSHRPLSDDYDRTKSNFAGKSENPRVHRSLQKYHCFQRFYGNSLDPVPSKLIVTQGIKQQKNFNEAKREKAHETKAEIIARENKKRLLAKEEQKEEQKWKALSLSIEEEMTKNLNSGVKDLEDFLKSCKSNSVKVQVEIVGLTACLKAWKVHCRGEGKTTKDFSIAVQMMKRIHPLMNKYSDLLQDADRQFIGRCLNYLGFDELAKSLYTDQDVVDDIKKKNKYLIGIGPARFQLQHMGYHLIREERKDPDPRVQDFIPDTWQRELLDVVDNYESAVIVAPTSSGKTYASYYCMEKVLKESDEGVVVYVAPTKALVNQVAATVQNRYTKNLPNGAVVCGVFTRDYGQDALNCQVLVTVPSCFEILLLAPHCQQWVKRIRYVIFDEIERYGFPADLALSPRESIQLYDTMFQAWKTWPQAQAKMVLRTLSPNSVVRSGNMLEKFPLLVEKLKKIEKLPTLFFIFNVNYVEKCARHVHIFLKEKQKKKRPPKADEEAQKLAGKLQKVNKFIKKQKILDEKSQISMKILNQSLIYIAEHNCLLKSLEKNLEIPQDCTYTDQKVMDDEVVTATGTLALGINMPCRSVVFAQNSVYLDALNYRQMSGRAGRRGQDLLGDVYFFDIPLPKVGKLIKSKVPELKGQFPLKITLILRLMLLASKADDLEDGQAKGYLDREGNPTGFAGLVSHLHYHEPSNLVFVSFLVRGLFHNLCQPTNKGSKWFSQDVMEKLVLVLANLFGRIYIPAKYYDGNMKFYQSKVFLDDLPEDFSAALVEYNMQVTKDFASFLPLVSKLADMKQEYQLPLSEIKFTGKECEDSQLVSHLMSCKEGRAAISPFVCLSGNFDSDLLQPDISNHFILRTLGINHTQAPILWPKRFDSQGRRMPLNAYALDFYKHGCLEVLDQDNGIHTGTAYHLLKDFSLIIKSISVSLHELCENEDDNVVLAFEQLSETYSEKFNKV